MNDAIGGILPYALAVAISPPPIIAVVLMLLSPTAKRSGLGFLLGWILGILVAISALTALSSIIPKGDPDASQPIFGTIQLVLGVVVLFLCVRSVRSRPRNGESAAPPKWMSSISTMTPVASIGFGFALGALNPKNLVLAMNAALEIGVEYLQFGEVATVIAVFTVIAASSVLIPVVAYLIAGSKLDAPLKSLEVWLINTSWLIMAVLLLVIGAMVIGNGIENF